MGGGGGGGVGGVAPQCYERKGDPAPKYILLQSNSSTWYLAALAITMYRIAKSIHDACMGITKSIHDASIGKKHP